MSDLRYRVEYDGHLRLYRWQIAPGQHLTVPPPRPDRSMLRVVALGGGTGLPVALDGLKAALFPRGWTWVPARDRYRLTAIVTVADDGGSSGRLREAYRVLPPGDVRNCLLALSDGNPGMAAIFNFRFDGDRELAGHSLGNLILTALNKLEQDFSRAVERGSQILGIQGQVFPSTLEEVTLQAEFEDGSRIEGESRIAEVRRAIRRVSLQPEDARALPQASEAIAAADLIVIGPGSLYTSLIPILLVKDLAGAMADSRARTVLVLNLMTEPGETDGYTAVDHVLAIRRHAPGIPIHNVLVNATPLPEKLVQHYAAEGATPVPPDLELLRAVACQPVTRDLLGSGSKIRHDPSKLAHAVLELAMEAPE